MNPYKIGDKVKYLIEDDKEHVYTVLGIYGPMHVSLSLKDYDDTEQDNYVHIWNIEPA